MALTERDKHFSKTTAHIGWQTQNTGNIVAQTRFLLLEVKKQFCFIYNMTIDTSDIF